MKFLYLFPHIPKTGGAALFENVERSLPRSECLRLNCTHRQYYHDPRTGDLHFYERPEDFKSLLNSLNQEERSKFRFLSGHDLSFGLHQEFPQPVRYFTFIREPIARTISLYNYQLYQHEFLKKMRNMDESHRRLELFSQKWFLRNGKIPSFEEWLVESYDNDYHFYWTMSRFLKHYGFLDNMAEKFFFIGLTETMEEDELYMYSKMGIRRFWANRNASFPYVSQLHARTIDLIRQKNKDDFAIYEQAKVLNHAFKKKEREFYQIVEKMRSKKRRSYLKEKALIPLYYKLREYV